MSRPQTALSPLANTVAVEQFPSRSGAGQDRAVCLDDRCDDGCIHPTPRTRAARFIDALLRALSVWTV